MRSPSLLTPLFLVTGGLLFSWSVTAMAFTDVPLNATYKSSLDVLVQKGAIGGYADNTFRPNQLVNRAEFLKVLLLTAYAEADITTSDASCFSDHTTPEWYFRYACFAKAKGIVGGYPNGSFEGMRTVNLAEALKMTMETMDTPLPQYFRAPDNWYDPYMDAASSTDLFTKIERNPAHELTRAEMAMVIDVLSANRSSSSSSAFFRCTSSEQCGTQEYCSTEDGDCMSACPDTAEACILICAGVCKQKTASGGSCTAQKADIDALLAKTYSCQTDSDCGVVVAGCPLVTCGAAVSVTDLQSVQSQVEAYGQQCSSGACAKCAAQKPVCNAGKCALERE